jgi:cytidine deaminase
MPKRRDLGLWVEVYASAEELGQAERHLLAKAREACASSYSPYSRFEVGAAVLLANGEVVQGSNQENAAYPSGLCAERTALFAAGCAHAAVPVLMLAVTARRAGSEVFLAAYPCGACRQVMAEYEAMAGAPVRVIIDEGGQIMVAESVQVLLPLSFGAGQLAV